MQYRCNEHCIGVKRFNFLQIKILNCLAIFKTVVSLLFDFGILIRLFPELNWVSERMHAAYVRTGRLWWLVWKPIECYVTCPTCGGEYCITCVGEPLAIISLVVIIMELFDFYRFANDLSTEFYLQNLFSVLCLCEVCAGAEAALPTSRLCSLIRLLILLLFWLI